MNKHPLSQNDSEFLQDADGYQKLSLEMLLGTIDLVGQVHETIAKNIIGDKIARYSPRHLVYPSIKSLTYFSAKLVQPLSMQIAQRLSRSSLVKNNFLKKNLLKINDSQQSFKAILNGIVGDHLEKSSNPLAISMQLRRNGQALSSQQLTDIINESQGKLLILIHGSCMNDLLWRHKDHDHGEQLAQDLGLTPIYLHYNSGLHISENGRQLSLLLESLIQMTSSSIELSILAHSMGGLVTRSACYYANSQNKTWINQLKKVIFLGTPHHGAPLEKIGGWFEQLLAVNSITRHFCKLTGIRSNGITDLRHGFIIDEDWQALNIDKKQPKAAIELIRSVEWFTIAAVTNKKVNYVNDKLIGDGLVTVTSALGQHKDESYQLNFDNEKQSIERNINHMELLSNPNVYLKVKNWLN